MIRKKRLYSKPRKAYEASRIKEENTLVQRYGLKNKREIWKTGAKIDYFRARAKALAKASGEEQQVLFGKLNYIGLKAHSIADVLALKVENLLERRLPTLVAKKGMAKTARGARQMVTHKKILVDGKIVDIPSFIVPVEMENKISLRVSNKKPKPAKEGEQNEQA